MNDSANPANLLDGVHVVLGAGPVGRGIARELTAAGAQVRVVTRHGTDIGLRGATPHRADLTDPGAGAEACRDAAVVYAAAQPAYHRWPQEFPALQERALDAAESAGAVYVSVENVYAYGPVDGPITEDLPFAATTRKGRVRAAMADQVQQRHTDGRLRTVAGRASDFFGPYAVDSAVGDRFFPNVIAGKDAAILGNPDARHTYTYVTDFARALVLLGNTQTAWGRAWHVPLEWWRSHA